MEETRVEQVQNSVFDPADVLVHRQPVIGRSRVDHALVILRAGVAGVVPGAFNEGIHGVGFALGGGATLRTAALIKFGHLGQRAAGAIGNHVFGQDYRQLVIRHRYVTTAVAVNDRNRAAPVALTADTPVAQAELGAWLAQAFLLQYFANGGKGAVVVQAVEFF